MQSDIVQRSLFLAAGQDDPHSVTITELCAEIARLRKIVAAFNNGMPPMTTKDAAAEITRLTEALRAAEERVGLLREALDRIAHRDPWTDPDSPERIARDTLAGAKP